MRWPELIIEPMGEGGQGTPKGNLEFGQRPPGQQALLDPGPGLDGIVIQKAEEVQQGSGKAGLLEEKALVQVIIELEAYGQGRRGQGYGQSGKQQGPASHKIGPRAPPGARGVGRNGFF